MFNSCWEYYQNLSVNSFSSEQLQSKDFSLYFSPLLSTVASGLVQATINSAFNC